MRVKNLSGSVMNFPQGYAIPPGATISIPDAVWAFLQYSEKASRWIAAGLIELNGTLAPEPILTVPAAEGGIMGRVVVLTNQAAYTALSAPRADTLYVWPGA